jgi:hypothetical protein
MKNWLFKGMLTAAIALPALSGAAWAQDFGCSNATLQGEYAFGVTNLTTPRVAAGIKVFDGYGTLTQRDYRGNSSPVEFTPPGQEVGTYKVSPDCTGSMKILLNFPNVPPGTSSGEIDILFVISDGGRHIHEVVSSQTPPGSTGPVPVQTSADDWKVASEQDQQQ